MDRFIQGEGKFVTELAQKVNRSERGMPYTFKSLAEISKKIFQEIEVLIIGCQIQENLHRYQNDQEMYETCDVIIEMIDGGFWEIFSKDENLINNLSKKYKDTKFLTSDFQKKYL